MDGPNHSIENVEGSSVPVANLIDSRTSHLDDVLLEKLEKAFNTDTPQLLLHHVAKLASEYDPIDLANTVVHLPLKARVIVYEALPDFTAKIIFMIHTGSTTRTTIFKKIDDSEIKRLIESMPPDEAVEMLEDMSDRRMKRVLERLHPKKAQRIQELQSHDRHSAGRLMTNEFFCFPLHATIGDVARVIRENPGIELTRRIFVTSGEGQLVGYVPGRTLIVNRDEIPLRQVMRPVLHTVRTDASRDEVVEIVERYEIPALPVVNEQNHIVGVISYEDVIEVMEDIADETIASIAGTAEDVSEHEPLIKRYLWRLPWLIVTLLAGLVTATAMTHFSNRVWFVFLPFFVPLISGMSGNVGIQCSTILVRAMSTGELSSGTRGDAMTKEICIGLLIGITFGLTCGVAIYLLNLMGDHGAGLQPYFLGTTIGAGIFGACLTASVLGAVLPFFFAHFRIDPAVAAGPIVTAFNDVVSTLMFFLVARLVYGFFTYY